MAGSRWAGAALVVGLALGSFAAVASAETNPTTGHEQTCYSHGATDVSDHGGPTSDGSGVVLNPYGEGWIYSPNGRYEQLTLTGVGGATIVFMHPVAGTVYTAPGGVLGPYVLCKGNEPQEEEATTTTVVVVTTTTPEGTTSSVPVESSTTLPAETTTTVVDETTVAPPVETTQAPVTTVAPPVVELHETPGPTLPATGSSSGWILLVASLLAFSGVSLLIVRRRPATV